MATTFTDWQDKTVGLEPPEGFTQRLGLTGDVWVVDVGQPAGGTGKALMVDNLAGGAGLAVTPNALAVDSANEVVAKLAASSISVWGAQVWVRVTETGNTGYSAGLLNGTDIRLFSWNAGAYTTITTVPFAYAANSWVWMRMRVDGDLLYVRAWADGEVEPTTWNIVDALANTTLTGVLGLPAVGARDTGTKEQWWDKAGFATGVDSAPTSTATVAPPTANAGPDSGIGEGYTAKLDGTGSTAAAGETITGYSWTVLDAGGTGLTNADIANATAANASFLAPQVTADSTVIIQLQVTQSDGQTATDTVSVTIENVLGVRSGHILSLDSYTSTRDNSVLSLDAVDGATDIEIVTRFKAAGKGNNFDVNITMCASGAIADATMSYYLCEFNSAQNRFRLVKGVPGNEFSYVTNSSNYSPPFTVVPGQFYWMRARRESDGPIMARIWKDGTTEPDIWHVSGTDIEHQGGWHGLGFRDLTDTFFFDIAGFGVGGEVAPIPALSTQHFEILSIASRSSFSAIPRVSANSKSSIGATSSATIVGTIPPAAPDIFATSSMAASGTIERLVQLTIGSASTLSPITSRTTFGNISSNVSSTTSIIGTIPPAEPNLVATSAMQATATAERFVQIGIAATGTQLAWSAPHVDVRSTSAIAVMPIVIMTSSVATQSESIVGIEAWTEGPRITVPVTDSTIPTVAAEKHDWFMFKWSVSRAGEKSIKARADLPFR